MATITSRHIQLKSWPKGVPSTSDFKIADVMIDEPGDGEVLVKNIFMSVDPYMRGRLRPGKSYVSSFNIGSCLDGGCVGTIEQSKNPSFTEGSLVMAGKGFRDYFVSDGSDLMPIDPGDFSPSMYLGILGMPGRTAYVGLLHIGLPKAGETVYVSAAAGAVGSAVCQIAKIKGCRVVGSAGSEDKVRWLIDTAGVDGAFNYKNFKNLSRELRRQTPDGVDVYFENVGGDHLEAAISNMNDFGRIVVCGMISLYNDEGPRPGPSNISQIISKRIKMQGFIVSDHPELAESFDSDMKSWIRDGKIHWEETILEGLDHAIDALIGLFTGSNMGKMIVRM